MLDALAIDAPTRIPRFVGALLVFALAFVPFVDAARFTEPAAPSRCSLVSDNRPRAAIRTPSPKTRSVIGFASKWATTRSTAHGRYASSLFKYAMISPFDRTIPWLTASYIPKSSRLTMSTRASAGKPSS